MHLHYMHIKRSRIDGIIDLVIFIHVCYFTLACQYIFVQSSHCVSGALKNSHRLTVESSARRISFPLIVIHSDVWTSPILSNTRCKYVILFVDDCSRYTWVFSMRHMYEVLVHFHTLHLSIKKLFMPIFVVFNLIGW